MKNRKTDNNNYILSQFYCVKCGRLGIPVFRKKGQAREAGHLKKLWCLTCAEETNHAECKEFSNYTFEDFVAEFEFGNFNAKGDRIYPYNQFKELIRNGKVKQQKTLVDVRGTWYR